MITKICLTKSFIMKKIILRLHKTDFLEKYGMLYDLLEDLVTNKTNTRVANADEMHLIVSVVQGYDKNDLCSEKMKTSMKKVNLGKQSH